MNLPFEVLVKDEQLVGDPADRFAGADVIVDALFGAGLDRPLSGPAAELVEAVNGAGAAIVAVDLPSGINGATGEIMGECDQGECDRDILSNKAGTSAVPGRGLCGSVTVAQIGIETGVLDTIGPAAFEIRRSLAGELAAPGGGGPQILKGTCGCLQRADGSNRCSAACGTGCASGWGWGSSLWHRHRTP